MRSLLEEFGYKKFDIENKIIECWNNIFDQKNPNHFYFETENGMGYIEDTGNDDVRTEGMSYGMMMAIQMDRKDIFDRIWKWARTYMYLNKGTYEGYFSWSNKTDGTKNSEVPAPDGEEYFAAALFFASARWGDGEGIFKYSEEAKAILRTAVHSFSSMWNPENYMIRYVPNGPFTDPSYHIPEFYEIFSKRADEKDSEFWEKAAKASRNHISKTCHPNTGLAAEYANFDGTPLPRKQHGTFFSDSYRVATNIALDTLWCKKTPEFSKIATNIIKFFDGKKIEDLKEYLIDGTALKKNARHPVGLIATVAAASIAVDTTDIDSTEAAKRAVQRLWDTPMRTGRRRYYDNCLYFFAMLALSGKYQPW